MNNDDQTLALVEEFLGSDEYDHDTPDTELLDTGWDNDDLFGTLD